MYDMKVIYEWKHQNKIGNFGDALTNFLLPIEELKELESDSKQEYFLIGTVICDELILKALKQKLTPVFVSCGWDGKPLDDELLKKSIFYGCRGPLTQKRLQSAGIDVPVTLDSAYSIDYNRFPRFDSGIGNLLVPHILDGRDYRNRFRPSKIDACLSPGVFGNSGVQHILSAIKSSDFILGGAMHSCIVAHAMGIHFAPFAGKYIDIPFKWQDWLLSIGVSGKFFTRSVQKGKKWSDSIPPFRDPPTKLVTK